jgi:phosphohistidine phosphatase
MAPRKRELLLLRHGIAEERAEGLEDAQRCLTPEGRERTMAQLQGLVDLELNCDLVLSSPLVRARQTAELAVQAGLAPELELAAALAPLADPLPLLERWLGAVSPRPAWRRLALVGHEPDGVAATATGASGPAREPAIRWLMAPNRASSGLRLPF